MSSWKEKRRRKRAEKAFDKAVTELEEIESQRVPISTSSVDLVDLISPPLAGDRIPPMFYRTLSGSIFDDRGNRWHEKGCLYHAAGDYNHVGGCVVRGVKT